MNLKQRHYYLALWRNACAAKGWDEIPAAESEAKRRQTTREALGVDSSKGLKQGQITRLFRYLEWLAEPDNLASARSVANPKEEAAADVCRRLIWKIRDVAKRAPQPATPLQPARSQPVYLSESYIQQIAAWDCREAQVTKWIELPEPGLRRVLAHVNQRANEKDDAVRPRGTPRAKPPLNGRVDYVLRPAPHIATAHCPF